MSSGGLPASRIHLVENALPDRLASPPREDRPRRRGKFAFFGQINPYKWLDLLLEAIALVAPGAWEGCSLAVHGSGLERQPPAFRARLEDLLKAAGDRVTLLGPYRNSEVAALMSEADWLVVPSIWWENSPVVIQEAFASNLPVIAANLGGMAEKVRDGIDGMLFRARDPHDLARVLVDASNPQRWEASRSAIKPPPPARTVAEIHVALYRGLLANWAS
jgi:glycosyltransferase involved in cell wall biosynthesis